MSKRYKGAVISATPPTTSTSSASGVWTEQQFMQGVASGSWPALAGAPTIGTATAGALSASVAFTAPTYVGSGITGYTATSSPGGITGTGASSPIVVSGLTAGTAYTFTVTATTAAGQSSPSAASNSVTPTSPVYIEETFSTYLYAGNNGSQTIVNGVNLSTYGGMVWIKDRTQAASHYLQDTVRGANNFIITNNTNAEASLALNTVFNTDGFSQNNSFGGFNGTGDNYVSWTFREQPKFFDVVTYTGTGVARTVAHNLGSVPGCMIVKKTSSTDNWLVYHRGLGSPDSNGVQLNSSAGQQGPGVSSYWNNTLPTSAQFTVGTNALVNQSGETYVAYLFAHDAGGFGLTSTDNVISCGSYTGTGSTLSITLGYEPQWVMIKRTDTTADWQIIDNMRGWTADGVCQRLVPNTSDAEAGPTGSTFLFPTATGFGSAGSSAIVNASGGNYIYVAIRRGPMAVPTVGTSVFSPVAYTGNGADNRAITTGFVPDTAWWKSRSNATNWRSANMLIGVNTALSQNLTAAEENNPPYYIASYQNTGYTYGTSDSSYNQSAYTYIAYGFQRAPGFHDVVCYTGNGGSGSPITVSHNLGVVPELMIVKGRNYAGSFWNVYTATLGNTKALYLNVTTASTTDSAWGNTTPTSTVFTVGSNDTNNTGKTYVAYLFATCAGVSKVGSYTGTGALITVNCGFTSGARFVLIRRTDATGNWYTYDTARGLTSGNDPSLWVNSASAETTGTNYVDTDTTGFKVTAAAPAQLNDPGGTYIFLAIA